MHLPTSSIPTRPIDMAGLFHRWLVGTQIGPAFQAHPSLRKAEVLLVPALWLLGRDGAPTQMMIFYAATARLDLDMTVDALANGTQDPHLPPPLSNYDLYAPIVAVDALGRPPPFAFCARESFHGLKREPSLGYYEDLDAFAAYGSFARDDRGDVACLHFDAKLCAMLDRVM